MADDSLTMVANGNGSIVSNQIMKQVIFILMPLKDMLCNFSCSHEESFYFQDLNDHDSPQLPLWINCKLPWWFFFFLGRDSGMVSLCLQFFLGWLPIKITRKFNLFFFNYSSKCYGEKWVHAFLGIVNADSFAQDLNLACKL